MCFIRKEGNGWIKHRDAYLLSNPRKTKFNCYPLIYSLTTSQYFSKLHVFVCIREYPHTSKYLKKIYIFFKILNKIIKYNINCILFLIKFNLIKYKLNFNFN